MALRNCILFTLLIGSIIQLYPEKPTNTVTVSESTSSQEKQRTPDNQKETTKKSYTEITNYSEFLACCNQGKYILVKFYAEWCDACNTVEPAFEEVAAKYKDSVIPIAVNIDNKNAYMKLKHHVDRGVPTIVLLDQYGEEVTKQIGSSDSQTLEHMISPHINKSEKKRKAKQETREKSQKSGQEKSEDTPQIASYTEYTETIKNHKNVVIFIHADWCSPCRTFKPTFAKFAQEHPEAYCCNLIVDDMHADSSLKYELGSCVQKGIPATVFIQDGIVLHSITGAHPKASLEKAYSDNIGAPQQKPASKTTEQEQTYTQKQQKVHENTHKQTQTNKSTKRRGRNRRGRRSS